MCIFFEGFSRRCTRVSVPLRVVPSSTGLPLKRYPGIGFLSRVDQEIGVFQNVAPHTRLHLEFLHAPGLITRCAGKVGNPFQTKNGSRPSSRNQEGRSGSDEVVPGTSVFPRETRVSGNFWNRIKGVKFSHLMCENTSRRNLGLLFRRCSGQGPHLAMTG